MPYEVLILLTTSIAGTFFSYFLLRSERKLVNILFAFFSIASASWALFLGLFFDTQNITQAYLYAKIYYISAAAIPMIFYLFVQVFKREDVKNLSLQTKILPIFFLVLSAFMLYDPAFIIKEISIISGHKNVILNLSNYTLYTVYFLFFVYLSYRSLFKTLHKTKDVVERLQLKYVIVGTAIGYVFGMIFNLFLPALGNYNLIWVGPLSILIMVAFVGYSIVKHKLFNLKVIATELFVFVLWVFIFIKLILSETTNQYIENGIIIVAITVVGALLIRSVAQEVAQRKRLEKLSQDLGIANTKLKELDQQKSQFLSIASHQFRSPLTAIKGYTSLILEGSFGEVPEKFKNPIKNIYTSAENLVLVVEDFLNISRIEQGRMKYNFEKIDLGPLIQEIVESIRPVAEQRGLSLSFEYKKSEQYVSNVDVGKLRQVIVNLIDNAAKYTPKGWVKISLDKHDGKILFAVADSGVGISKENIGKLFEMFVRTENAHKVNVMGTGLGLYVAKQMIEAHNGRIWAESDGEGKGSTFFVELKEEK